jgi:hypothetical protein
VERTGSRWRLTGERTPSTSAPPGRRAGRTRGGAGRRRPVAAPGPAGGTGSGSTARRSCRSGGRCRARSTVCRAPGPVQGPCTRQGQPARILTGRETAANNYTDQGLRKPPLECCVPLAPSNYPAARQLIPPTRPSSPDGQHTFGDLGMFTVGLMWSVEQI